MNIDTDKLVEILKNDKPLSVMVVEDNGKDKLVCLFALPELSKNVEAFGKNILDDNPTYEELVEALECLMGRTGDYEQVYGLQESEELYKAEQLLERIK